MAENDVNRLIDMLYERVEDAKSPALKPNLSMVDRDEILDLLDELRSQLPVELKRAQELLAAREKFRKLATSVKHSNCVVFKKTSSFSGSNLCNLKKQ